MTDEIWLNHLHPKRKSAFLALSEDQRRMVMEVPEARRIGRLRALENLSREVNGRNKWVEGLEALERILDTPGHFTQLVCSGKPERVEAVIDLLIDFQDGEHENTRHTDPFIYDLISKGYEKYQMLGYTLSERWVKAASHCRSHPELQPLPGRVPTDKQKASRHAMRLGARIRRQRKRVGLTQVQLAKEVSTSAQTIKHLELGRAVSSHTLILAKEVLDRHCLEVEEKDEPVVSQVKKGWSLQP